MDPRIIVDDSTTLSPDFMGSAGSWLTEHDEHALFNGTRLISGPVQSTLQPPNFWFNFYGTDLKFYGPSLDKEVNGTYNINHISGTQQRVLPLNRLSASSLKTGVELFSIDDLKDDIFHSVKIYPGNGQLGFDYLTYKPSFQTSLDGKNLIVDDRDSAIVWSSGWTQTSTEDERHGGYNAMPYLNTMTGSSVTGSTMRFAFNGTRVSVYGGLNKQRGALAAEFWVDNGAKTELQFFDGTQTVDPTSWAMNQRLYASDRLEDGAHSLFINIRDATINQMLWLDSVVYEATANTVIPISRGPITILPPTTVPAPVSVTSSSSESRPWIAGIVLPLILVLALFGAALRFGWFSKLRRREKPASHSTLQGFDNYGDHKAPLPSLSRTSSLVDYKDASLFTTPPPMVLSFKDAGYNHGAPLHSPTQAKSPAVMAEWQSAPPHTRNKSQASVDLKKPSF